MVIMSNAAERTIKWGFNGVNMVFQERSLMTLESELVGE